jgi:hypothetical protein
MIVDSIDYQLEPSDFLAISKEHRRFSPDSLSRLYYFGVVPVLGAGLALATQMVLVALLFTVIFVATGFLINEWFRRSHLRNIYSAENLSLSCRQHRATLNEDGLRISSDAMDALYRWPFVRHVFQGSRYVVFEFTALQRVHIPIRAFRDKAHIQDFIGTAQSHIKPAAAAPTYPSLN